MDGRIPSTLFPVYCAVCRKVRTQSQILLTLPMITFTAIQLTWCPNDVRRQKWQC